jgi:hypothetical protein
MKTLNLSKLLLPALLLVAATSCKKIELAPSSQTSQSTSTSQSAAALFHVSLKVDDESYNWDDCTNEWIHFTGYAQRVFDFTITGNKINGHSHYNPEGEKGEGLSSGIQYQGVGASNNSFSGSLINGSYTSSFTELISMVAPGRGNNLVWNFTSHITFNANGDVTVVRDNFKILCR